MKIGRKACLVVAISSMGIVGCQSTQGSLVSNSNSANKYEARCSKGMASKRSGPPIFTSAPRYPVEAEKRRVSGYVVMEYDVSAEGKPTNVNVVEAYPGSTFNKAAKKALSSWRYNEGESMVCLTTRLDFNVR